MTKILLLIPTLDQSGAEKQLQLLATRLPRDEFDIRVAALTRGGPLEKPLRENGLPVTVLGKRLKFDPVTLWRLHRLVADWQPDILHTWLFAANAYARFVTGRRDRPKVIVSQRCVDTWQSGWQLWLDRRQIARTARLVGNSQAVADFYTGQGVPGDRISVIPNAVECQQVPSSPGRDEVLAEFDIPPEAQVVAYAGRLAPQKRLRDLIWAMQLLRQLIEPVYFLILGDGPQRADLEEFARQMTCDHLTRFAGHRHDAASLLPFCNLFWLASDFEGMSNSLMEAMAAGVPVLASDIPPNRELVIDGQTGYLVPVGDSVRLAQRAREVLSDSSLAEQMGTAGRERMRRNFSVQAMVDSYRNLYHEVLETG